MKLFFLQSASVINTAAEPWCVASQRSSPLYRQDTVDISPPGGAFKLAAHAVNGDFFVPCS